MHTRALPVAASLAASLLLLGACSDDPEPTAGDPGPSRATDKSHSPSVEPTEPADPSDHEEQPTSATAAYFIGDTERAGPRLYREFVRATGEPLAAAVEALASPQDPDYRTAWDGGQIAGAAMEADLIVVTVDPAVRNRPAGVSKAEAEVAVQQVVYTMQAAVQERAPVQFVTDGNPIDRVYGVPTSEPLANAPMLDVLAHVNLTSPEQGQVVDDGTLEVSGVGNSFEANVGWEVRQGDRVVKRGYATMEGWMEPRLFPFETTVDVGDLDPGEYTFWVTTDDPTGGTEGIGAMTDDREFVVE